MNHYGKLNNIGKGTNEKCCNCNTRTARCKGPHPKAGNDTEIIKWKDKIGMKSDAKSLSFFIGIDVGGRNCGNKPNICGDI